MRNSKIVTIYKYISKSKLNRDESSIVLKEWLDVAAEGKLV